jgi:hypothetical protein
MGRKVFCLLMLCFWGAFPGLSWASGEIHSGETKAGTISLQNGYQDSWTFDGIQGERVAISFGSDWGYSKTIKLIRSGALEASITQAPNAFLDHQLQITGQYTIVVSDTALANSYDYHVSLEQTSGGDHLVVSGQTLSGTTVPGGMFGYHFAGVAGEHVAISFGSDWGYNKTIKLFPPSGGPSEATISHAPNAFLDNQLQETGQYTIVVFDTVLSNIYDFNVSLALTSASDSPLVSGQTLAGATIPGFMKDYHFYGQAGERVAISFGSDWGYDKTIKLFPPSGGPSEATISHAPNAFLDNQLQETGRYTIVVFDTNLSNSYNYQVSLAKTLAPSASREDRDGAIMVSGQSKSGNVEPGDLDAFYFYGQAGDWVTLSFGSVWGYSKTIRLFPPSGGTAEAFVEQSPNASLDHQLAETGLYMAVVYDTGLSNSYSYSFSLAKAPSYLPPGLYNPSPGDGSLAGRSGVCSWSQVSGATGYDLYFGTDMTKALPKIGTNLTNHSLPYAGLAKGQVYYWRVIAHTPTGDLSGPYWWFETSDAPTQGECSSILGLLLLNGYSQ